MAASGRWALMPEPKYLSTDPNPGLDGGSSRYLSTDPNAGEAPATVPSMERSPVDDVTGLLAGAGTALAAKAAPLLTSAVHAAATAAPSMVRRGGALGGYGAAAYQASQGQLTGAAKT